MLLRMTRTPNAYPDNITPGLSQESAVDMGFVQVRRRLALVAAGVAMLGVSACSFGGGEKEASNDTSSSPEIAASQYPVLPAPETTNIPESQREVLQVECWKHNSVDSFLNTNTPYKAEIDLVKKGKRGAGIVSKILFDVDKEGMSIEIQPTGQKPIKQEWGLGELYSKKGDKISYDGKTVLRYPAWRSVEGDFVTFTIGCTALTPKDTTPVPPGTQPFRAAVALTPSK